VVLEQQRITLNRLMGEPWQANYLSAVTTNSRLLGQGIDELIGQAEQTYPPLQQNLAQLELTESVLRRSREQRKDTMDLVLSVGTRTRAGDSTAGSVNESDVAGQVRFEYRESLDKSGLDAEVRQAQLDRTIAMEEIRRVKDDLNYELASLVQEINAAKQALISARQHLQSEREKFEEALQRYRQGRTETDRLIQFENELNTAKLNVAQQKIELAKRIDALEILHGNFWQTMTSRMTTQ
jgi:outer membrane protein TolC